MKQLLLIAFLILTTFSVSLCEGADTTYSKIRIKKKKKDTNSGWTSSSSEDDSSSDFLSSCIGSIFSGICNSNDDDDDDDDAYDPYKAQREAEKQKEREERIAQRRQARASAVRTTENPFFDDPLHLMLGFQFGGSFFTDNIANGISTGIPLSLNVHLSQGFAFRALTGATFEGTKMNIDFERDVFVNGSLVGTEELITDSYTTLAVPLRLDLMFFPPSNNRTLFFTAGAGAMFIHEELKGTIKSLTGKQNYKTNFDDVNPTVHIGIGAHIEKVAIELGYDYTHLKNEKNVFVPSDNSDGRHAIKLGVSFSIF